MHDKHNLQVFITYLENFSQLRVYFSQFIRYCDYIEQIVQDQDQKLGRCENWWPSSKVEFWILCSELLYFFILSSLF